jgi:hypothetical protein
MQRTLGPSVKIWVLCGDTWPPCHLYKEAVNSRTHDLSLLYKPYGFGQKKKQLYMVVGSPGLPLAYCWREGRKRVPIVKVPLARPISLSIGQVHKIHMARLAPARVTKFGEAARWRRLCVESTFVPTPSTNAHFSTSESLKVFTYNLCSLSS